MVTDAYSVIRDDVRDVTDTDFLSSNFDIDTKYYLLVPFNNVYL